MKILGIDHLGIVPKEENIFFNFLTKILSLQSQGNEYVADQKVDVHFIQSQNTPPATSTTRLEIITPNEDPNHSLNKYLTQKGGGIHHLALRVDCLDNWLVHLKQNNIRLIDETPRLGAHKTRIAFVHPHSTGGILVELVETLAEGAQHDHQPQ